MQAPRSSRFTSGAESGWKERNDKKCELDRLQKKICYAQRIVTPGSKLAELLFS